MGRIDVAFLGTSLIWLCATLASGGCAGAMATARIEQPRSPAVSREIFNAFDCPDVAVHTEEEMRAEREAYYATLKLELAVDHVRLAHYVTDDEQWIFAARGEACATASNKSACEARLAQLMAAGGAKEQVFAITITGNELKLYEGGAVRSLLGAIDNVYKAWTVLMVHENVPSPMCQEPEWDGWREAEGGYDLAWVWTDKTCRPVQRLQAIAHVDREGHVTRLRKHIVEHEADACIHR